MAQLQAPFNANAISPDQGGNFKQLPIGKHPVVIVASEVKATNDQTGGKVVFDLEIIDGPNKGESGQWTLNLYNASDKARSIAEAQFSALCHVTGVFIVTDTAALHNKPFVVEVENQKLTSEQLEKQAAGQTVTPFTQVRKCYDLSGNLPGTGQQQTQQQPAQNQQPPANNGGWAGGQQNQQNTNTGWANNQTAQQEQPQQSQQPQQGGWGQQQSQPPANNGGWAQNNSAPAGNKPAWSK